MTNTLISPLQVIRRAFAADACLPPDAVTEADVAAAEQRYLVPVIGHALHQRLLGSLPANADFIERWIAPPLALCVRLLVQPRLDIRTGRCGTTAPQPADARAADASARRESRRALLAEADTLLHRLSDELDAHPETYPEYLPGENVLHRCSIHGKLVQIY